MSWTWIRQASTAEKVMAESTELTEHDVNFYQGKLSAAEYYLRWELPLVERDFGILHAVDDTCDQMQPQWF